MSAPELSSALLTSSLSAYSETVFSETLFSETTARLRAAGCVFAEEEARLLLAAASEPAELATAVERRIAGYPLEHILGWARFCGLRIAVERGVFVPRRRTELLVDEAVALLEDDALSACRVHLDDGGAVPAIAVDLCCGSGAVGVALAGRVGAGIELHAADIDPAAVKCALRNVGPVGGHVHQGDLYEALPPGLRGRVRMLVVNAPYVPTDAIDTMPHEARDHEPRISLDGGADGLDVHRRVAAEALEWLAPGGHLLIETSERQASSTAGIMAAAGFEARVVHSEDLDGTVVTGRAPTA
jgi:release factor glutamine methyltransferase